MVALCVTLSLCSCGTSEEVQCDICYSSVIFTGRASTSSGDPIADVEVGFQLADPEHCEFDYKVTIGGGATTDVDGRYWMHLRIPVAPGQKCVFAWVMGDSTSVDTSSAILTEYWRGEAPLTYEINLVGRGNAP